MSVGPPGKRWALVLGASSGFGAAAALRLAADGYDVFGVHLDSRATRARAEQVQAGVEAAGRRARLFNKNCADPDNRRAIVADLAAALAPGEQIYVLLHSLAFGVLKPLLGEGAASPDDLRLTCEVMGNDVVYWVQELLAIDALGMPARVLAMTSEGGRRVWPGYAPVSAAKALLEANIRQLAAELAPRGITANCLLAGVTDTPALRRIPGHEAMLALAQRRNPHGRLTQPEDVAAVVSLLCDERAAWITGGVIACDGGESIC